MKLKCVASQCLLVGLALLLSTSAFGDEQTLNLATIVIEDFDNPEESPWRLNASKFATEGFPQLAFPDAWPAALFGANKQGSELRCLGIHGRFDRKAYNYIEIVPVEEDSQGNYVQKPLRMPGRVSQLDLWVWGSNYSYYVEVHLRDFQGIDYVLPLGSLNYTGWKNLRVIIPPYIPQAQRHLPRFKGLELTKFVIWTRPNEKVDDFYIYVDHVKVLTDLFETRFDGDDLIDLDKVREVWGTD